MNVVLIGAMVLLGACAHGSTLFQRREPAEEALYRRALVYLDPANERGSVDSAAVLLDRYIAANATRAHVPEALALRRLIDAAQELARVEVVLHQSLAEVRRAEDEKREADDKRDTVIKRDTVLRRDTTRRGAQPHARPSAEAAREIQRLREELREANAELERIRKRLATPTPPPAKP